MVRMQPLETASVEAKVNPSLPRLHLPLCEMGAKIYTYLHACQEGC